MKMGALAGILNYSKMAGQALPAGQGSPMAASAGGAGNTSSTSSSSSSSATISANDFLSLLVTEMQNQDPTADTDPDEYINQLVQVNSLEQLIDINQNLSTALGNSAASSGSSTPSTQAGASTTSILTGGGPGGAAASATTAQKASTLASAPSAVSSASTANSQAGAVKHVSGNLSIPDAVPAAQRVARGLDGQSHAKPAGAGLPLNR